MNEEKIIKKVRMKKNLVEILEKENLNSSEAINRLILIGLLLNNGEKKQNEITMRLNEIEISLKIIQEILIQIISIQTESFINEEEL